jgi:hypothetical protein
MANKKIYTQRGTLPLIFFFLIFLVGVVGGPWEQTLGDKNFGGVRVKFILE